MIQVTITFEIFGAVKIALEYKMKKVMEVLQSLFHTSNLMINTEQTMVVFSYQTKWKLVKTTSQIQ
jgi:hypothetical protein